MERDADKVIVIGAGMGGLAAATGLASAGLDVTVIEAASGPGGKMRTVASAAGPVDAGPTVLTMRWVFEQLFAAAGARLDDHVRLIPQSVLARHWWADGSTLDLHAAPDDSAAAVRGFGGTGAEADFRRFSAEAARLYRAFERPVMRSHRPDTFAVAAAVLRDPGLIPALLPAATLAGRLAGTFRDARLAQLFGRYATYVGGSPYHSPAVLGLIWETEAQGVWAVEGGMHGLARAMAALAGARGARLRYGTQVERIVTDGGRVMGVALADGEVLRAGHVIFNGDPAALAAGLLGPDVTRAVPAAAVTPRSHSAWVWSFAARARGLPLAMHNVIFTADPRAEFGAIAAGRMPDAATLYVCAQDRAGGYVPDGPERFEIILNAPPTGRADARPSEEEYDRCRTLTFDTLTRAGLSFDPLPGREALTGPAQFAAMFPGSQGSLYGRSPHGLLAAFRRPGPATRVPGLWLAGGGTHPGAGVPMATLSGMNASAALISSLARRASTSRSARRAMPGGTSTGSPTTQAAPSRS